MRSMFSNANFARYDLGAHVLGQLSCPTGQTPMRQNGRIVCVPYSPPSSMFMPQVPGPNIAYGSMGQAGMPEPYLTQQERDQILLDIETATSKIKPIDNLIQWGVKNDPGLKKYLGSEASRFMALADVVTPLYPTVKDIQDRLSDTDAESWYRPSDDETAQVRQWTIDVNEMYKIISNHKANFTPAPGTVPPPNVEIPAPPSKGIPTQTLVIGGVAAVGLAFLLSAL